MFGSAPSLRPADLVVRCYVRRVRGSKERWVAHCIDLDLWAAGDSLDTARSGMRCAIAGYLETVLDTADQDSIPRLLRRCAPLRYRMFWQVGRVSRQARRALLDIRPFEEALPFRLAVS